MFRRLSELFRRTGLDLECQRSSRRRRRFLEEIVEEAALQVLEEILSEAAVGIAEAIAEELNFAEARGPCQD